MTQKIGPEDLEFQNALGLAPDETAIDFLRSILAAVPAFITRLDSNYKVRFINFLQPGVSLADVKGADVFNFMPPDVHDEARRCFESVQSTLEPSEYASMSIGADGQPASYRSYVTAVKESDGSVGLCLVSLDTTHQNLFEN